MSISSLRTSKKSCVLLVLALVMQVYQVQSTEMLREQQLQVPVAPAVQTGSGTPSGSNLSSQGISSWGQSAYSAVSSLPIKAQAGLAGLATLSTGYGYYRGKLWLNKSRALKNYSYLITTFNSDLQEADKKGKLIDWINNNYPRLQQAKEVTERLRTGEQLEVIRFPFTVFKQELEQVLASLGSDSLLAWARGKNDVETLKKTLTDILTAVKTTKQYNDEAPPYAAYLQSTTAEEMNKKLMECNGRVLDLLKHVGELSQKPK